MVACPWGHKEVFECTRVNANDTQHVRDEESRSNGMDIIQVEIITCLRIHYIHCHCSWPNQLVPTKRNDESKRCLARKVNITGDHKVISTRLQ